MTKKKCQSVSESHSTPQERRLGSERRSSAVSPAGFRRAVPEEMAGTPPRFSGRVEHIVSGQATRFHSPEELWAFFAQALSAERAKPP